MNNVPRSSLLPGHDNLVSLIEEFGIRTIVRDEEGFITIFYNDENLEALNVIPPWVPVAE